jgi:predicted MFS family arabinose efflux permease
LSLAAIVGLAGALPSPPPRERRGDPLLKGLQSITRHPSAVACLLTTFLLAAGNENIGIVYGAWMEGAFGLHVAALGAATAVFGLADLGGEGLVAFITDRLGKKRAAALGAALNTVSSHLLRVLGRTLPGALVGLFAFYLIFEFAVVSLIPIVTEVIPQARGTLPASNIGAHAADRAIAALAALPLLELGFVANGVVKALLDLCALGLLIALVRLAGDRGARPA